MPSNTTDRNQNARQSTQDDTSTVRSLTSRSTDYHRLPKALRAIVDAYAMLDLASDHMGEASEAARSGDLRPADRPDERMLFELRSLVEHTLWEIRRHGVIEGAIAWLASHPEGWDDEPEPAEPKGLVFPGMPSYCLHGINLTDDCPACESDARMMDDQDDEPDQAEDAGDVPDAEGAGLRCPSCGSAATVLISPLTAGPDGWVRRCKTCGNRWNLADDEGESVRTRDCHGCKRQFQPGDLCEQWAHAQSPALPVRSLCADCSWPAEPAKRLKRGGYALRIGYTVPGNVTYAGDQGDDPLLHGYPREWFTGDRS